MESHSAQPSAPVAMLKPPPAVVVAEVLVLIGGIVLAIVTASESHWSLAPLGVIAVFTVFSDMASVRIGEMRVSGGFLGILLAAVLLGGGPAAAVAALSTLAMWPTARTSGYALLNNLGTFIAFPLLAGLFFHGFVSLSGVGINDVFYYLLVFATVNVALAVNFLMIAGHRKVVFGESIRRGFHEVLMPMLAPELFSAVLTMAAVYIAVRTGTVSLALLGLVTIIFQYLTGELLKSRQRSKELQRIATTDELTGLANRERFSEAIQERAAQAAEQGTQFAVMLMDLDRFKEINDTLGHHYGDVLLRDLGPRLVETVGPSGLVARLGGDEFGILPGSHVRQRADVEQEVERLIRCVSEPFSVDELSLEVGASIGVSRFPTDGEDSHALLRCADIAMYAAKEAQTDFKVYTAEQNQHTVRRLSVLSDIRHALADDQIVVHYQPIVSVDDRAVMAAEGLVRWEHPERGLIPPGAFVQTVEQTGLIGPLTRHVLERSIAECASWRSAGRDLSVAVNLSVRNLLDRDLPREIGRLLDLYSLPADALQLEITESMIMSDPERAMATVSRLSGLGVRLSVDDFGTGYSSLANLRRLPIDELKIDRSFVSPMLSDESDLIIVRSTINLGHDLGLKIIAEGVEDADTLDHLAVLGCDLAQGYHLSRPLASDAFDRWLQEADPMLPRVVELAGAIEPEEPPAIAASGA